MQARHVIFAAVAALALTSGTQAAIYFQDTFTNASGGADTALSPETGSWRSATFTAGADSANLFGSGVTNGVMHVTGLSVFNDARNTPSASPTLLDSGVVSFDFYEPAANTSELRIPLVIGGTTATANYIRLKDGIVSGMVSGSYTVDSALHVDAYFNATASPISAPGVAEQIPAGQIRVYLNGNLGTGGALPSGTQGNALSSMVSGVRLQIPNVTGADFYVDNLAIQSIPEPVTASLVSLGALTLLRRRRV